jgi:tRNA(Ile)-lysidine synthase
MASLLTSNNLPADLTARLYQQLHSFPDVVCYWVAFSGGVDSHALLHALARLRDRLKGEIGAVHVNHGLHEDAGEWEAHCRELCRDLAVQYVSLPVDARPARGESPEAAARAARYSALENWLPAGHCLLMAQHQDDQAETLLLQLLRGSGVKGLAAMPARARLGAGHLLRPLLDVSRQALQQYAIANRLHWVEDPSNRDTGLDRNFLRHQILPELRKRWPVMPALLSRSARHCAEAAMMLEQLAEQDVMTLGGRGETLPVSGLLQLSPDRLRNALRYWLMERCGTTPSTAVLARLVHDILGSRPDASPCVRWGGHEVRRYRDRLYLLRHIPGHHQARGQNRWLEWALTGPLELPDAGGVLSVTRESGRGLRAVAVAGDGVRITFRRGGERCRPAGRHHHHSLKKLFQEQGVPPWERGRIPLIYIDNKLAAVTGYWVCEPFSAAPGEPGLVVQWSRAVAPLR